MFVLALLLRANGQTPPFDDVYHLKRIASFPRVLEFDPDRGERGLFCPWPPLYDMTAGALSKAVDVRWIAPVAFAGFAAALTFSFGPIAGVVVAISPYLLGSTSRGDLDHHYLEPMFVVAMMMLVARRRHVALGLVIAAALMVQPALIVSAGVCFVLLVLSVHAERSEASKRADETLDPHALTPRFARGELSELRRGELWSFLIPALVILAYRLTRPPGYPDSPWFLGYPHVAALAAAAVSLVLLRYTNRALAIAAGASIALAFPSVLQGLTFFAGDPWLRSIQEFQPMFRNPASIGTDIANLTGGAVMAFFLWRRHRELSLFAIVYLVLSLSSRRFLVAGIPLFAIAGSLSRQRLLTIGPPLVYLLFAGLPNPSYAHIEKLAGDVRALPPGRILAPWSFGHAIDVLGRHPVVIDNFGSMPGEAVFMNANDAFLTTHVSTLLAYCRGRGVRFLVLIDPRAGLPAAAAANGRDPSRYEGTRLAERTVWWRVYRNREPVPGLRLVRDGAVQIWTID